LAGDHQVPNDDADGRRQV